MYCSTAYIQWVWQIHTQTLLSSNNNKHCKAISFQVGKRHFCIQIAVFRISIGSLFHIVLRPLLHYTLSKGDFYGSVLGPHWHFFIFILHTLICKIHTSICKFYTLICKIDTLICKIYTLICKSYTLICKIYTLICKIHTSICKFYTLICKITL